ncbi:flagellar basal body P-ring formation chaperone FlgA [Aestuariirhabdus litorea]|uniref:Flagella basal body P-ring formation protein FlgA n=1 Tax=Aestuariirhabdus litorea TaxID=2528527 RepID=A0A3P3VTL7_9GAMM|nr:flagellar basal body P-ring formation chaperone FlgA [Aestuariirhabdus litorea]RRJ85016.1 flagella basal body P-ring formation protein FlgA [Aestuariirhabdus litorea]RWW98241.1 flagellar basal body P-ring formation protein FlgA [Endozoicomonadaceae bacterium GTF-13]
MRPRLRSYLTLFAAALFAPLSGAQELAPNSADLKQIQVRVKSYLLEQATQRQRGDSLSRIEVEINPLDPRLQLPRCSEPTTLIEDSRHHRAGRQTVRVECRGEQPWGIYLSATVKVFRQVITANRLINKRESVNPEDLLLEEHDVTELRSGYFTALDSLTHMQAKRTIRPGQPLSPSLLQAQQLIEKGDTVTIEARGNGLTVRMMGTALSDGEANEQIRVKNNSSEKIIRATVTGPKRVEIVI